MKVLVGIPGRLKMGTMSSLLGDERLLHPGVWGGSFRVISGAVIAAQVFLAEQELG